jgi:hypothetical protein
MEYLAEPLERAESNSFCAAGLEHRKMLRGDADAIGSEQFAPCRCGAAELQAERPSSASYGRPWLYVAKN